MISNGKDEHRSTLHLDCACNANEHLICFTHYHNDEDREIYLSTFLNHYDRWYRRLWRGIKYIFGFKSRYGHFDETIIGPKEAKVLIEFLKKIV